MIKFSKITIKETYYNYEYILSVNITSPLTIDLQINAKLRNVMRCVIFSKHWGTHQQCFLKISLTNYQ